VYPYPKKKKKKTLYKSSRGNTTAIYEVEEILLPNKGKKGKDIPVTGHGGP
jgi:hypothetical protein